MKTFWATILVLPSLASLAVGAPIMAGSQKHFSPSNRKVADHNSVKNIAARSIENIQRPSQVNTFLAADATYVTDDSGEGSA